MKPSILIVIPTYGHFNYAAKAIESALAGTSANASIVVIDDASPDKAGWDLLRLQYSHLCEAMKCVFVQFPENGGLTRSWNHGLGIAKFFAFDYCCVTNSDVLFSPEWDEPIIRGLNKFDLVGPVTNAPGTNAEQYIGKYSTLYCRQDGDKHVDEIQRELGRWQKDRFKETTLNGFCMVARTKTWTDNAFDKDNVFRPRNDVNSKGQPNPTPLMTLNEYELQTRWHAKGLKTAACLGSYVYHYRAVSRGDQHKRGDWARMTEEQLDDLHPHAVRTERGNVSGDSPG